MAGILKVDKYQDFNGNDIMTSDGAGNITINNAALKNAPAFILTNSGNQSISTGTWTQLTFDTTALDTDSAISSNTFTVPSGKGGAYTFFWGIHGIQGLDLGEFVQLGIYVNNVRSSFSDNRMTSHTTDVEFKFCANFQTVLSAGDTVKAYVYQNEGASQNATNASFSGFKLIGV